MRKVIRTLSMSGSKACPASLPAIAALTVIFAGGFLPHPAAAQDSPQTPATQPHVKHAISAEALAMHARAKRPAAPAPANLELAATASLASTTFNSEQGPGPGPIGPGPGCNLFPAPASIGTTVPLSYFGPPPSDTNRSLVGPVQLLNTGQLDVANGTITIPLYLGHLKGSGKNVWYILTDVDDSNVAAALGLNFSTKLTFASHSARTGDLDANGNIVFDAGTVNFKPERKIIPGPPGHEFPPTFATPGAVGDANYGPLVKIANAANVIYNAPMVAFDVDASQINFPNGNVDYSKVHDQVVAIDPANMTVTINLINGFSFGKAVWYISMDSSIPLAGANEQRQGLSADLADGFRPNNVVGGIPTNALDYSPAWDAQLFEWTQDAINKGYRGQVREEFQILTFVQDGLITSPGGGKFGSSGFSINCAIVQRLN